MAGAVDVTAKGDGDGAAEIQFVCPPSALGSVRRGLEAAGLRPLSATVEFVPRVPLTMAGHPRAAAEGLLRALEKWPELVRVYHNVQ